MSDARTWRCVTFFPHLIAGPIVQYRDMMPQMASPARTRIDWTEMNMGLTLSQLSKR